MGKKKGRVKDRPGKVEHQMVLAGKRFEIKLADEHSRPMANVDYTIRFEGGTVLSGTTDENGVGKHWNAPDEEDFEVMLKEDNTEMA